MKIKTKKRIILLSVISLIFLIFIPNDYCLAYNNAPYGPNSETPDKPKYFNFINTGSGIFQISHYGTHDWIADAALRSLKLESVDWDWLLDDELDKNPKWIEKYSDGTMHYPVRSYISYLFSTQMPDMNPNNKDKPRPHNHPQKINLWGQEGEIIGNGDGTGVWVGKWYHQTMHYWPIFLDESTYLLVPKDPSGAASQKAPWYAWKTSQKAIECLTKYQETNEQGKSEIWAKPEAGACWFGVMSHFIADLTSPAHLIAKSDGYYPASPSFHGWFEKQVSKFTIWDDNLAGPKGFHSKTNFFKVDLSMISDEIVPFQPHIAAIIAAEYSISKSYKYIDEGGLFIRKGDQTQESLIDDLNSASYWEWGTPGKERNSLVEIVPGGLTYKQYYDKVEYLLNVAIYFTASALKWSMVKVKEKGQPDYDKWAKIQYKDKFPDERMPVENPKSLDQSDDSKDVQDTYKSSLALVAMLAPIYGISLASYITATLLEKMILV